VLLSAINDIKNGQADHKYYINSTLP